MRTGLIARKLGMTRVFNEAGVQVPVTLLKVNPCVVVSRKTQDKNGYTSLELGSESLSPDRVTKPLRGKFEKLGLPCFRLLKEFRVTEDSFLDVGTELGAAHFASGQYIDVTGISLGKGFAGAMKRHNFGGLRATHGVSVSHRSHGSTGNRQDPGKVFKNKKMAGHMGSRRVTKMNLRVHAIDEARGVLMIHGAVPGSNGQVLWVRDAVKKKN